MNNLWYQNLNKPIFTPPAEYFPIAWGILYTLMFIALVIIISKPNSTDKKLAIILFFIQFVLNILWSYLFFGLKSIHYGLFDVILLFFVLIFTIIYFYRVSKIASLLLIPYLLQVFFAIYLNFGFAFLN